MRGVRSVTRFRCCDWGPHYLLISLIYGSLPFHLVPLTKHMSSTPSPPVRPLKREGTFQSEPVQSSTETSSPSSRLNNLYTGGGPRVSHHPRRWPCNFGAVCAKLIPSLSAVFVIRRVTFLCCSGSFARDDQAVNSHSLSLPCELTKLLEILIIVIFFLLPSQISREIR